MSTVTGPGGHRYAVGQVVADVEAGDRVAWPELAELVRERFRLPADHGLVVDEHAVPVLLDRVDAALVDLARHCPEAAAEVGRIRRLIRPVRAVR